MKRIINIIVGTCALISVGCSDLLDTDNTYQKDFDTFYQNKKDIDEALNGLYNAMFVADVLAEEHVMASLLSDLMLAGGGPDDSATKGIDSFQNPPEDTYRSLWLETYNGVYRANAIIEKIDNADLSRDFVTQEEAEKYKKSSLGEAYFMRGFLMFRAAKFFGGMPIIPSTDADRKVNRSSFSDTFNFIASDMMRAIEMMPEENITAMSADNYGHATVWAAKSYLARIFLFYTGYMTNIEGNATDVMPSEDGDITKAMVISHLEDVINESGHDLVSDFRNLWAYSNVNDSAKLYDSNYDSANPPLPWAADEGLAWAGQDGVTSTHGWSGNKEVIFSQRYGLGNWDWDSGTGQKYSNRSVLFMGVRGQNMIPFGEGWGWCPVHTGFFQNWDDADKRKVGSVIEMGKAEQGTAAWASGRGTQETSLMNKKYTTLIHNGEDTSGATQLRGMFYWIYKMNHGDPMQLWGAQDFYLMRFADVLLMHSELTESADGLNRVRERAGYAGSNIAYSLEAVKQERKYELAFEGLRWFDLVRWGDVNNSANNYYGDNITVTNSGVVGSYSVNYRPETKGLMPIPQTEIRLSSGVYKQNDGWN